MLNSYVDGRLYEWAEWSLRRKDNGTGFPHQVSYINQMPRSGQMARSPEFNDQCYEVERCVQAVKVTNVLLHQVIVLAYLRTMTAEQRARELGCSTKTYYNKLDRAQQLVLGFLNDLAADVPFPVATVKKVA